MTIYLKIILKLKVWLYIYNQTFLLSWRFCYIHLRLIAETGGKTECVKMNLPSLHVSWQIILIVKIYLDTQPMDNTKKM